MSVLCPHKEDLLAWASANAKYNRKLPGAAKGAVRILPGLYLGNAQTAGDAATLENLKVSAVCSVGPKSERVALSESDGARLLRVPIQDNDQARILPFLSEVCAWIEAHLQGPSLGQRESSGANVRLKDIMDRESSGCSSAAVASGNYSAFRNDGSSTSVLVHCRGGMNRSPTVIAAYLIRRYNCAVEEAMQIVKEARPAARFGRGPDGVLQTDLHEWAQTCAEVREKEALGETAHANIDVAARVVEHTENTEQ
mmetsp:Transcript_121348/g.241726  ORF Transcript_121348/g.241726 Transcript_121348/m.241726 type:complete len:254 (+) Transcript_121348:55-816(+)